MKHCLVAAALILLPMMAQAETQIEHLQRKLDDLRRERDELALQDIRLRGYHCPKIVRVQQIEENHYGYGWLVTCRAGNKYLHYESRISADAKRSQTFPYWPAPTTDVPVSQQSGPPLAAQ